MTALNATPVRSARFLSGLHFGFANGKPLAFASIYSLLMQQALLISFTEIFMGCAIVAAIAAVVGWLFRKVTYHHADPGKALH